MGYKVEHKNKKDQLQNSFCLKLEWIELWYFVVSISVWISIKFVHIMPWGQNYPHPGGPKLQHKNKEDQLQNLSSLKLEGLELWYLIFSISFWTFISSFEHKVLRVSYCDRPMSVNNFYKHLLLLNHWANLDETWQGCSLCEALQKLFKEFNSILNCGCHGNQKEKNAKSLENFSETRWRRALIFGI